MCFRFGSCFGSGSGGQDVGRSTPQRTHLGGGQADHSCTNNKSGPQAYHHQPAASDQTGRNAYNDGGTLKDHFDDAGGHGGYTTDYAQDSAGDTLKPQAAWNSKVVHDTGYTHTYKGRLHEAAAGNRWEKAVMDHRNYPATTGTTLERC